MLAWDAWAVQSSFSGLEESDRLFWCTQSRRETWQRASWAVMSTAASRKLAAEGACGCSDVRTACSSSASRASFTCSATRAFGGTCTHAAILL